MGFFKHHFIFFLGLPKHLYISFSNIKYSDKKFGLPKF